MGLLNDKVAIVTGAASGIGRATALAYAREGANVVIADLNEEQGQQVVSEVEQAGRQSFFKATDVGDPEACRSLVEDTVSRFGKLDVACNNAGIGGENNPVGEMSLDGWRRVIEINLSSVFYCMTFQIPAMLESGGGSIVNMASIMGQVGVAGSSGYVAAKHGVIGLTKSAALENAPKGVRINAVGPAFVNTPILDNMESEARDALVSLHPIGRLANPEEIGELVVFLSSERASFITGAYYPADGAYLAQ